MSFFRSAALRRSIYAIAIALALVRLAARAHSEPLVGDVPADRGAIVRLAE
jgi:hypothetical protein